MGRRGKKREEEGGRGKRGIVFLKILT